MSKRDRQYSNTHRLNGPFRNTSPDVEAAMGLVRAARTVSERRRAYDALVRSVGARLVLAARSAGLRAHEADDVAQAKLGRMSAVTGEDSTRDLLEAVLSTQTRNVNAFVWTAGVRAARDYANRACPETAFDDLDAVVPSRIDDDSEGALELKERARRALASLDPGDLRELVRFYGHGESDDAAVRTELGRDPRDEAEAATVRLRIQKRRSRAKRAAREALEALSHR